MQRALFLLLATLAITSVVLGLADGGKTSLLVGGGIFAALAIALLPPTTQPKSSDVE